MTKQTYTVREYTEQIVNRYGRQAKVTWIDAGELLDLLNRVEEGDKAQARLAEIEAEELDTTELDCGDLEDLDPMQGYETGQETRTSIGL